MNTGALKALSVATLGTMLLYVPAVAGNDKPAASDIGLEEARQAVLDEGYTEITGIEFDDGQWEVEARDNEGRKVDVKVDAATGRIININR